MYVPTVDPDLLSLVLSSVLRRYTVSDRVFNSRNSLSRRRSRSGRSNQNLQIDNAGFPGLHCRPARFDSRQ